MSQLSELLASYTGPVLFVVIFAEMMGFPFPAASVLVAAGVLAADGGLSPSIAIAITVMACLLGDSIWFFGGRLRGNYGPQNSSPGSFGPARTQRLFAKYGGSAVAAAKFIPGVGFLIPAFAGAFRMPVAKFVCFDLLGSLLYGIFYIELGFFFSGEVTSALAWLSAVGWGAGVFATLPLALFAGFKYTRLRNRIAIARPVSSSLPGIPALPKEQIC